MNIFQGYRRENGQIGIRNHVLVLSNVTCANSVVEQIGWSLRRQVVALPHVYGCGQGGQDLEQTHRTLLGTAAHPNVAGVLLVSLGCETLDPEKLAEEIAITGKPVELIRIQSEGGTRKAYQKGLKITRSLVEQAAKTTRQPVEFSELVVGVECGGSDGYSGITANPAVGAAADLLVEAGATVILSEVPEMIGAETLLAQRVRDEETRVRLLSAIEAWVERTRRNGIDLMGAQIQPGNWEGGLTTPEEKSLGAVLKGGTTTIQEFVDYAVHPTRKGLVIMDTPGDDVESMTGMVASGAHAILFTTGRGSPTGHPTAPVFKIASNSAIYSSMRYNLDYNAGAILTGNQTIQTAGRQIFQRLIELAGGQLTRAEKENHREFAINTIGPRV